MGTPVNPIWSNVSLASSNYAGNLLNGATGARQLNLGIVTLGNGATQAIDVIRRRARFDGAQRDLELYIEARAGNASEEDEEIEEDED